MVEELLRVDHVSKHFAGVLALNDVSLVINKGETRCLVGENGSGKSTLIKIISGVYTPDEGDIIINGHHYQKLTPIESIHEGIQVIYQDFSLFPNLTVAENIAVNDLLSRNKKVVNWKEVFEIARKELEKINVKIDLDAIVGTLSTADRQLIAISKALLQNARLIIMDEPTTTLTQKEVKSLFKVIDNLKEQGISVLFVSHKLDEVAQISDRTIILRNGEKVLDEKASAVNIKKMEIYMTGREIESSRIELSSPERKKPPLLKVENLNLKRGFFDISFELKSKEVLGITGLLGSGRTELALALFGELPADSGKVSLEGKQIKIKDIQDAIKHGIAYVPEDRILEGLFLQHTIGKNIVVRIIDTLKTRFNLLDGRKVEKYSQDWVEKLNVKTPSYDLPAQSLSGGNQQRLVLAKWLASNPKVLILNGPTVGVDVGSKAEIHEIICNLAKQGVGILLISDDIPELMRVCSRILLMRKGRIVEEFKRDEVNENLLNKHLTAGASA